jgi:gluconokinase
MSFTEWLELRWLGRAGVSISQASGTGLLHQDSCRWDPEMLESLRLDASKLSPLVDLDDRADLSRTLSERWPALRGARWLPAAGDGALNNVGAGCAGGGRAALMIGTSGALRLIFDADPRTRVRQPFGLWRYRLDRRRIVVGGALSNGGNVREWVLRTLGDGASLDRKALRLPPASHGLTMLPFLTGTRSPDYLAHASGVIAGLRPTTAPEHVVRAAMEAVAYRFALVFDLLHSRFPVRELIAAGGALEKSRGWTQIIADVVDRPIAMSAATELTSRGAALVALEQLGVLDASRQEPPRGVTLRPDPARHTAYRSAMTRQRELLKLLVDSGRFW